MLLTRTLLAAAIALTAAVPAGAFGTSGAYLAARQAAYQNDFEKASEYFTRALALDPGNASLMESAMSSSVALGQIDKALPIARRMVDGGSDNPVARMVVLANLAHTGDYEAVLADIDGGASIMGALDALQRGWALMGTGKADAALSSFDEVAAQDGVRNLGLYHKALALASVGDFEGADDILSGRSEGAMQVMRRGVVAHAEILSQLDRNDAAIDLIRQSFGSNPAPMFRDLERRLSAGETLPYDVATSPEEGMAETFFSIAAVLASDSPATFALLYSRVAEYLNPAHLDAILLSASLLEDLEQFDLATAAYDKVPRESGGFITAELGRAKALDDAGRSDAAVEVLRQLAKAEPDMLMIHVTLADTLRQHDRFAEASEAYDRAIELIDNPQPEHWVVWFSRGIARERTDRWDEAEADFRRALELNPGQPQVLNYLGYSMVELGENLNEALAMIEEAVAARPQDGYITDSLGWVFYRLGRYDEAVEHMERAVELEPVDPILNDHLGDVYWAVGRRMEARFQWHRAMSFDPEPEDATRIRRKLEVGLDVVLSEEGAEPLAANDG